MLSSKHCKPTAVFSLGMSQSFGSSLLLPNMSPLGWVTGSQCVFYTQPWVWGSWFPALVGANHKLFSSWPVTMARLCTTSIQLHWPFVEKAQEAGGKPAALLGVGKPECCKYFFWSLSHYSHYYCGRFSNFNDFLGAIDFSPIKREQAY